MLANDVRYGSLARRGVWTLPTPRPASIDPARETQ